MKIESITVREIQMPLVHFFETSFGRTMGRRIVLVTVQGEGLTAWGECVAGEHPHYSDESVETAWYAITKELAPLLLGKDIKNPQDCVPMMASIRGRSEERRVGKSVELRWRGNGDKKHSAK